jgi:hypothetical protein
MRDLSSGKKGIISKFETYIGAFSKKVEAQFILNLNEFIKM